MLKHDKYGNKIEDRDDVDSPDWKYLAQQLATAYRRAFYEKDRDGNVISKGPSAECIAAVEAITRANDYGMGA